MGDPAHGVMYASAGIQPGLSRHAGRLHPLSLTARRFRTYVLVYSASVSTTANFSIDKRDGHLYYHGYSGA